MKRIVIKSKAGSLYYNDAEHGVKLEPHEIEPHQRRLLLKRLHEYEDAGLTPEQIISIANELKEYKKLGLSSKRLSEHVAFCHRYHELFGSIDFSRLMELKERDAAMEITEIHVDEYYCPACGAENNCDQGVVKDNFCPRCGQRLKKGN